MRHSLLLPFAAAFALSAPACAEPAPKVGRPKVERIVAFGDSYADNGNIFRLAGAAPPAMYPQGRFSDGTNFVDTMGSVLKVPILNFALGGAVTGPGDSDFRPAGLDVQTRAFLSGRGSLGFPRTAGRFAPGDLVVISIGGNDARRYGKSFGAAPGPKQVRSAIAGAPAAADRSVANTEAALRSLTGAGAANILFLGGDVGRLPEVKGTAAAAIGSAFSARYNRGVRDMLGRLSRSGVAARYVDLDSLGDRVEADPAAYGLSSTGACPQACLRDPALARRYLFYVDRLHFTAAGYAIVGRYALEQLS
ncbi:MAG TPA: SGNH/GDSL hydrolase family protein, partial [Allosphingosinicella sp.]|nr:SGNH/GDSL hydrolase family protein [Allosphingosinicella sp.]